MLYGADTLKGYKLSSIDGDIGKVEDFYFDDRHWAIRYLVAETGSWLTGRQVLISPYALRSVIREDEKIAVNLNKSQIEDSPPLDTDRPVSRQLEEAYAGYYGWPTYWSGPHMWGPYPYISRDRDSLTAPYSDEKSEDPHLRSIKSITGHNIQALDGEIGHVDGFIIDDDNWAIRYLVIDTRNWWPGKKVLASPQWITRVSWDESKVFVNLSREAIRQAPEYDDESLLTRDYESQLHRHYNLPEYWVTEQSVRADLDGSSVSRTVPEHRTDL